ncbi:MAG TPA: TIGR04255 family protein, partial [Pirellulales bacterium]|nr:TIGR04255 family protein [Pirellulales bacterium]
MPLPEFPRVIYGKNPLEVVICQLRFPPILRIGAELPAEFQERIRKDYPEFRDRSAALGMPAQFAQSLPIELSVSVGART